MERFTGTQPTRMLRRHAILARRFPLSRVVSVLPLVLMLGCALSTEIEGTARPMEPVEPVEPVVPMEPTEPMEPTLIEDCEARCEDRSSIEGFCGFSTHPESGDCVTRCEEIRRQSPAVQEAFLACLESDPLCFSSIGACVLGQMYPDGMEASIRVRGEGISGHEEQLVQGAFRVGGTEYAVARDLVRDGSFDLLFIERLANGGRFVGGMVHLYLDTNGNERCDTGADPVSAVTLTHEGDFDEPLFSAVVDRAFRPGDAILCDLHND